MHQQIIVGHDGGAGGADALALALALADARNDGTQITVASVYPYVPGPGGASGAGLEDALRADAEERIAAARESVAGRDDVSFTVRRGTSPAQALHLLAAEADAALIAVGRSHTGPVTRLFVGSVTEQTLVGAPCPVAVAPVGLAERPPTFTTIGVAYDGSDDARHALEVAADLARRTNASVRMIRALQAYPIWYGGSLVPYPVAELRENAEADLATARGRLTDVDAQGEVVIGDPRSVLTDATDIDVLVVGSRGFGPLRRVVLGSTGAHLARHATTVLLVVPRVAGEDEQGQEDAAA